MTNEVAASAVKAERLQTRASTKSDYIDELAERMTAGDSFPAIVIFTDGTDSWLADGIHRLDAAIKAKKKIGVEQRKGTRSDAVEFACGANSAHGLRRSNADKRRSVKLALEAFPDRSSRSISELCGVSNHLVEELRKGRSTGNSPSCSTGNSPSSSNGQATRVGRDGRRRAANEPAQEPAAEPAPEDAVGNPIPAALVEAFEFADIFHEQSKALGLIKKWATDLAGAVGCSYLHTQSFVRAINGLQKQLKFEAPYALCPYCLSKKKACEACKGRGFVTKPIYDGAPSELRV